MIRGRSTRACNLVAGADLPTWQRRFMLPVEAPPRPTRPSSKPVNALGAPGITRMATTRSMTPLKSSAPRNPLVPSSEQLPKIGADLENIAAALAEAQAGRGWRDSRRYEGQLQVLDNLIGQAVKMGKNPASARRIRTHSVK